MNRRIPIAVVGIGGVFPGATDVAQFWDNIAANRDMTRDVPPGRWMLDPARALADRPLPDRVVSLRGAFVDPFSPDLEGCDVDPALLAQLDPLYSLALHAGNAAWRDAVTATLDRSRVGVILAAIALPTDGASAISRELLGAAFLDSLVQSAPPHLRSRIASAVASAAVGRAHPLNAGVVGLPAAILARALRLGGGAYTLDAACASSLYAIKLACDELAAGRADAMLTGGASRPECLYTQMGFTQLRALSRRGVCAPFDAAADGLLVGEGAGLLVLKRLDDAVRENDKVYAVIRGIGLSNDIGGSLLAPDSEGQLRAMRLAFDQAGWRPDDVDLIECHGTGTPTGDAVEIASLRALWDGIAAEPGRCPIGSVKSMIGHLLTGAGAAGLIKVLLAMRHESLPPTANFSRPNPQMKLEAGPFRVQTCTAPWLRRHAHTPRRAAVSAFGFGGINAHLLVEQWHASASSTVSSGSVPAEGRRVEVPSGPAAPAQQFASPAADIADPVPIAIVGMSARFGSLTSLAEFRDHIFRGEPICRERPHDRWRGADAVAENSLAARGGFGAWLERLSIPVGRFRLPPSELPEVLPQQLVMLLAVADALADAGLPLHERRPRAGVTIGISLDLDTTNFHIRWWLEEHAPRWLAACGLDLPADMRDAWLAALKDAANPALTSAATVGALGGIVASRVARECSLGGPCFGVSAGEASGMRALEIAARSLQAGETDMMLTGAVDMAGDVRGAVSRDALRPLSADGFPRPFDASASGTLPGEGACCLVLKRLSDARRDGDRVYAIIRGVGAAGTDRPQAYRESLTRALEDARRTPAAIGMVSAHAASDPADDGVELAALADVLPETDRPVALASAKSIIGHAGAAAGLASVVHAALSLHHRVLPPVPGYEYAGERATPCADRLHIPIAAQYWMHDQSTGPRTAVAAAMTIEGQCAHIVLEESATQPAQTVESPLVRQPAVILSVEGGDAGALCNALRQQLDALAGWTATIEEFSHRCLRGLRRESPLGLAVAIVAAGRDDLRAALEHALRAIQALPAEPLDGRHGAWYAPRPLGPTGELAFVFPGSGNHYVGMTRELGVWWPHVHAAREREVNNLAAHHMAARFAPWRLDWRGEWREDAAAALGSDMRRTIFGQVSHCVAVHDLLCSFGIRPRAVLGYSLGESASLFATRAWPDADEMFRRMMASTLFVSDLAGERNALRRAWGLSPEQAASWRAVVVARPAIEVREALSGLPHARLMIVNAPEECVVGGLPHDLAALAKRLRCRPISVEGVPTVHFDAAFPVERAYRELHIFDDARSPSGVRVYSAHFGGEYHVTRESAAESITGQALHGFDFVRLIESAYADGVRLFVETGPQATCTRMIRRILCDRPCLAASADARGETCYVSMLRLLAALAAHRVEIDWQTVFPRMRVASTDHADLASTDARVIEVPVGRPAPAAPWPELAQPLDTLEPDAEASIDFETSAGSAFSIASAAIADRDDSLITTPAPHAATTDQICLPAAATPREQLIERVAQIGAASGAAHRAFLAFSKAALADTRRFMARHADLLAGVWRDSGRSEPRRRMETRSSSSATMPGETADAPPSPSRPDVPHPTAEPPTPLFDRRQCLEFAVGRIANVLGPRFAEVDAYPVRVRLPAEPLMLVDRILSIDGQVASLSSGRIVTEHDVHEDAWYLDGGRAPVCVTVEAGQADLFLSSYLGIDLAVKGTRAYRLLDATVTFHRELPRPGETIHYDIRINRFVRQGDTYLFFFEYDGTIDGRPMLTMRNGCAGFFTDAEIANSGGLILTAEELALVKPKRSTGMPGAPVAGAPPFHQIESYTDDHVGALRRGDLAACFGPGFDGLPLRDPVRLPEGRMTLFDRVLELNPTGGRFGLGTIRAEADIHPDDWFLTCHFVDDMTMPGTLMYECCVHALRFFLLRMGWVAEQARVCYQPIPGIPSALKCRGPVTPSTKKVIYEVDLKEIGYRPEPYVLADAIMYADGRRIVSMRDMSLRMTGTTREELETTWERAKAHRDSGIKGFSEGEQGTGNREQETTQTRRNAESSEIAKSPNHQIGRFPRRAAIFQKLQILAFSNGNPSEAFGEPYRIFDRDRVIARLPGPPFQFLDRVVACEPPAFVMKPDGWVETEYDIPPDAWYFAANRQPSMPFAVLLEAALQPCGWLAAYAGSALLSDSDLSFRNLGGRAILHEEIWPDSRTLTARVRMTKAAEAGGMIIQDYDMRLLLAGRTVYEGVTTFGFFSKQALAQQLGIRDAAGRRYIPAAEELSRADAYEIEKLAPFEPGEIPDCDGLPKPTALQPPAQGWPQSGLPWVNDAHAPLNPEGVEPQSRRDCAASRAPHDQRRSPAMIDTVSTTSVPHALTLPARALLMLDRIDALSLDGGPARLGFVRGSANVNPDAWFFKAHFYQDPVWPGSLGLESFIQLLKAYAIRRWGRQLGGSHRFEPIATGLEHTWAYRGQILPTNRRVEVEAVITRVEEGDEPLVVASGFLTVDGITIYEMKEFGLKMRSQES